MALGWTSPCSVRGISSDLLSKASSFIWLCKLLGLHSFLSDMPWAYWETRLLTSGVCLVTVHSTGHRLLKGRTADRCCTQTCRVSIVDLLGETLLPQGTLVCSPV